MVDARTRILCHLVVALGFCAAIVIGTKAGLGAVRTADSARAVEPPGAAAAPDVSRFLLNALLVPALDGEAAQLRWVDPRDGWVQLTVVRENWGFSASVSPGAMRLAWGKNGTTWLRPGAASLPTPTNPTSRPSARTWCRAADAGV